MAFEARKVRQADFHQHTEVVTPQRAEVYRRAAGAGVAVAEVEGPYRNPRNGKSYPVEEGKVQVRISGTPQAVSEFWQREKAAEAEQK